MQNVVKKYAECTGCNVCLLPCPVWRCTRDLMLTMSGRISAIQAGALPGDMRESIMFCTLCGACKAICPGGIDTVEMMLALRKKMAEDESFELARQLKLSGSSYVKQDVAARKNTATVFVAGAELGANELRVKEIMKIFSSVKNISLAADNADDLVKALEAGLPVAEERKKSFLSSLSGVKEVIAAEGMLYYLLRQFSTGIKVVGLGEAILSLPEPEKHLRETDLYVIDARFYHTDHKRLAAFYDQVRQETGCVMNLDIARAAVSTTGDCLQKRFALNKVEPLSQTQWILDSRRIERIVVENICDLELFKKCSEYPVIHVSELLAKENAG